MAASKALVVAFQTVFDFPLQFPAAWHSATRDLKCLIPESYAIGTTSDFFTSFRENS
jgi:hypothetical protein